VAAVEFAFVLPFLTALAVFAIDFTRIFYVSITLENCVHNGALFGSQAWDNQNQQWIGNTQYWQGPNGQLVSLETVAAQLDGANLNPALADANVNVSSSTDADGNPVNLMTITYTFNTLVDYPGVPSPVSMSRTAQVRVTPAVPK
jgi:Flp pilus assembly protein TadG